jgi:hypothetical protein
MSRTRTRSSSPASPRGGGSHTSSSGGTAAHVRTIMVSSTTHDVASPPTAMANSNSIYIIPTTSAVLTMPSSPSSRFSRRPQHPTRRQRYHHPL